VARRRKAPDALIFRIVDGKLDGAPEFRAVDVALINFFRWRGWYLLAREDEIRYADLGDVRRADENRGRPEGDR
jgi:hypothetical protein